MAKSHNLPEAFIQSLRQEMPGYASYPERHQMEMAAIIWGSDSKRRQHKSFDGHISISQQEIRDRFGKNGFANMNDQLRIFEKTPNWSVANGETKGYRLTDEAKMIKNRCLAVPSEGYTTAIVYLDDSGNIKKLRSLLEPIASKQDDDRNGISDEAWRDTRIMSTTPVDIKALVDLHVQMAGTLRTIQIGQSSLSDSEIAALNRRIDDIGRLIMLAHTDLAGRGRIAIRYAPCSTGRLCAQGVSLQTTPRIVRQTALQGLYDYDVENCHYAIFEQMAARYGYQADAIRHYLDHKAEVRNGIAERVGITVDQAKTCLLAAMYGARTSTHTSNAIPKEIGAAKAGTLYSDPQFKSIAEDISKGRSAILRGWPKKRGTISNDLDKPISSKESPETITAHLLQGVEASALKAAISLYPDEVVLLMHDGFVTTKQIDVGLVEKEILSETGYRLALSGSLIMPMV